MNTSIVLARVIGPLMLVMGLGLLLRGDVYRAMAKDFMENRGLIYIAGFVTLVLGLLIVVFHNVWVPGWPVIITILGWIMVLAGIARMNWPDKIKAIGARMIDRAAYMTGAGVFYIAIGALLAYVGYLA